MHRGRRVHERGGPRDPGRLRRAGAPGPARPPRGADSTSTAPATRPSGSPAATFLAFLDHDDELAPDALLEVAALLQDDPGADLIYSDHDLLGEDGRRQSPRFAPDWSPELLLSYMYIRHLKVYRAELVRAVGGFRPGFEGSADYDLALRLAERTEQDPPHPADSLPLARRPGLDRARDLGQALQRGGGPAGAGGRRRAPRHRRHRGAARLRAAGAGGDLSPPVLPGRDIPVTIVIPTRDRLDLLRDCIDSIEQRTTCRAYRILIVDNDSREPRALRYLARSKHAVLRSPGPSISRPW